MPIASPPTQSSSVPAIKFKLIAGGAAGNLTVTGIGAKDKLLAVVGFGLTEGTPNTFSGIVDLLSEFTITAANTINNTGGTATTGKLLLVVWWPKPAELG